ncbi:phosphatidylserine decarboxylase [Lachnospiraceae bacterium XBB1006]|nr:phosphatidylserine decarboxylase [Lachnospiraceae bacterium XBB1006]
MLEFLYETGIGRLMLRILTRPRLSIFVGKCMDASWSRVFIPYFLKKNGISLKEYVPTRYESFNACFCRRIRSSCRPIDRTPKHLIAPCDGYLSAYPITRDKIIPVKQSWYRISDLLRDKKLAKEFEGGTCLVFRLCVHHYHRYCYPDAAVKEDNVFLPGILHTVRPIALRNVPVFTENAREYTILHTENFGDIIQMEVGAMLVGKIKNFHGAGTVKRGQEKGHFLYGGSTIILLLKKDAVKVDAEFLEATKRQAEVPVKMGQKLGEK